jgi:hypothetical protein
VAEVREGLDRFADATAARFGGRHVVGMILVVRDVSELPEVRSAQSELFATVA